ncbi:MAG: cysteine desulfurase [Chloroflexi bacterium]|nr:cysteine desulfurase [Chloroflexota bacterium]
MTDLKHLRKDFPIFSRLIGGRPVIYLDTAATSLKPVRVGEAMLSFHRQFPANINRGVCRLSEEASRAFGSARENIASFINSPSASQVIFTQNTTQSINIVASSLPRLAGDRKTIILTEMEHHSNLLPWMNLAGAGFKIKKIPVTPEYSLDMEKYRSMIDRDVAMVSVTHVSNVLGMINPVKEIIGIAHDKGAIVMVDAAQSAPHIPLDVVDMGCDFLAFSAHKMLGPTGVGVLYGKKELLEALSPPAFGGGMVTAVSDEEVVYNKLPQRLEAGTPAVESVLGFSAAADYLREIGFEAIRDHQQALLSVIYEKLPGIPGVKAYLPPDPGMNTGMALFSLSGLEPHELSLILDRQANICMRSGMHCAQPLVSSLCPGGLCRVSMYLYNTVEEIEIFLDVLKKVSHDLG